jgi:ADP-ribosyl-[dinitrogen reductase] hydrolase
MKPGPKDPRLKGSNGEIRDFHPFLSYPPGSWSDDMGMTLATIRGLINHARSRKPLEGCLRKAFKEWACSDECRQAGQTVYHSAKYGKTDENAWSSGALMRTAPVSVYAYLKNYSDMETAELAYQVARLTHGHPLAVFPAVECTLALRSILSRKRKVPRNLTNPDLLAGAAGKYGLADYLEYRFLKTSELPATTGLYLWKQVFEDLLRMQQGASWSSLPWFPEGILRVVNQSVDRDTAGAVAGALLGAQWGVKGIPFNWITRVEKSTTIFRLAQELIQAAKL